MCIYLDVRKSGAFHIPIKNNWVSHIHFVEKRGPIIYLAALKKVTIWHAHPYYAIYRKLPPLPPTRVLGTQKRVRISHNKRAVGARVIGYILVLSMSSVDFGYHDPASIIYKSTAGRHRPVSYPDGPITARCRFIKNAYWGERTNDAHH